MPCLRSLGNTKKTQRGYHDFHRHVPSRTCTSYMESSSVSPFPVLPKGGEICELPPLLSAGRGCRRIFSQDQPHIPCSSSTFFIHLPFASASSHLPHLRPICSPSVKAKPACLPVSAYLPHLLPLGQLNNSVRHVCRLSSPVLQWT